MQGSTLSLIRSVVFRHGLRLLGRLAITLPMSVAAAETPPWDEDTLTGSWNGTRSSLFEKGIALEFTHRSDVLRNLEGGLQRGGAWLGYTDARGLFDLEKLYGWTNMTGYVQFHSTLGDKPNEWYLASSMGTDNIEAPANTAQLYHAWVQKSWLEDSVSLLLGLYPVDAEFYVTDTSGLFLHPSLGMAAEVAQSGLNGPPVYPLGSLGTRIKYISPNRTAYLQAALLDGVPGDPANPYGTQIKLNPADGTFAIAEIGYTPLEAGHTFEPVVPEGAAKMEPTIKLHEKYEEFNKTAFGVWRYSTRFDDLTDLDASGNPLQRDSSGWYLLAERTLYSEADNPNDGLAAFFRFGVASADILQSDWSASLGARYRGLLKGRDDDIAGLAISVSHASPKHQQLNASTDRETALEATYRIQLRPWLAVQPLWQRIVAPGMVTGVRDATLLGTRLEIFL